MLVIHYHKSSGFISAYGNGDSQISCYADHEIARFEDDQNFDPAKHKIDISTLKIVDKSPDEIIADKAWSPRQRANVVTS